MEKPEDRLELETVAVQDPRETEQPSARIRRSGVHCVVNARKPAGHGNWPRPGPTSKPPRSWRKAGSSHLHNSPGLNKGREMTKRRASQTLPAGRDPSGRPSHPARATFGLHIPPRLLRTPAPRRTPARARPHLRIPGTRPSFFFPALLRHNQQIKCAYIFRLYSTIHFY